MTDRAAILSAEEALARNLLLYTVKAARSKRRKQKFNHLKQ
jgi:hypothetical protein